MMRTAFCAADWWAKKLSSKLLRSSASSIVADLAFPGRTGVGDEDVDAAKDSDRLVEGGAHLSPDR